MQCFSPIALKPKKGKQPVGGFATELVPCGKCAACLQRRISGWAFRLDQESKIHQSAFMVTLTYSDQFLPFSKKLFLPTLRYSDIQKFFKRLRINTGRESIRYYAAGEYGPTTYRPHYHIILFDASRDEVDKAWRINDVPIGFIDFKDFHANTCAYAAKYCAKERKVPIFEGDDRQPEFSHMSKGIGLNYLTPQMVEFHQNRQQSSVSIGSGIEISMPRYYRDRLFSELTRERMNEKIYSGSAERQLRGYEEYGYSRSLSDDHPSNQLAKDLYYHSRFEGVKAANACFFKRNKRDKFD